MNEREIRRKLIANREAGFVTLVRGTSPDVYRGLVRLVRDRELAEDISQDTYIRAWKALRSYPDERIAALKIRGWLWTIAVNRARTHLGRPVPAIERPAPTADVGEVVAHRDEAEQLLQRVAEPVRTELVLRHVVGLSYAEVAEVTGRPIGTVKSDVHRAIRHLKSKGLS